MQFNVKWIGGGVVVLWIGWRSAAVCHHMRSPQRQLKSIDRASSSTRCGHGLGRVYFPARQSRKADDNLHRPSPTYSLLERRKLHSRVRERVRCQSVSSCGHKSITTNSCRGQCRPTIRVCWTVRNNSFDVVGRPLDRPQQRLALAWWRRLAAAYDVNTEQPNRNDKSSARRPTKLTSYRLIVRAARACMPGSGRVQSDGIYDY